MHLLDRRDDLTAGALQLLVEPVEHHLEPCIVERRLPDHVGELRAAVAERVRELAHAAPHVGHRVVRDVSLILVEVESTLQHLSPGAGPPLSAPPARAPSPAGAVVMAMAMMAVRTHLQREQPHQTQGSEQEPEHWTSQSRGSNVRSEYEARGGSFVKSCEAATGSGFRIQGAVLRLRSIFFVLSLILLVPLLGAMSVAAFVLWDMPPPQSPRLRAPHEVVGVHARGTTMWVVPVDDDAVVVIDAGLDPEGHALLAEIRGRTVLAVLLTHAHLEQVAGLAALPEVPVYVGEADQGLLRGEERPGGWLASWFAELMEPPTAIGAVHPVQHEQSVELGGEVFRAIHVPGHTDGHLVWAYRDVLFTGGAVLASNPLKLMPRPLSNDPDLAERSLDALLTYDFDVIADGHSGFTTNARAKLHRLLDVAMEPPQISLQGPQVPGPGSGPVVEQIGLLVPAAPPSGEEGHGPTLLVLDAGPQWVLEVGDRDVSEFHGRRVTVRGTLRAPEARPGLPGRLVVDVDGLALIPGQVPNQERRTPRLVDEAGLADGVNQWRVARGTVRDLVPLAAGAAFGEGTLVLERGGEVGVSAPLTVPTGASVEVLGRIIQDDEGLWFAVHRECHDDAPCL